MNKYDEKIKNNQEKIKKLQEEIDKRKNKISRLQAEIKQLNAEKDNEFSQNFLKKLSELGINSPEDREILMSRIEDFALEQEIAKSETSAHKEKNTSSSTSEAPQKSENFSTTTSTVEE